MSIDLDAIRARADAAVKSALIAYAGEDTYLLVRTGEIAAVAVAAAEPALLALVDAQAARINKAREAVAGHGGENGAASGCPSCRVARALTEDVAQ